MKNLKTILIVLLAVVIVLSGFVLYYISKSEPAINYKFIEAKKGMISNEIKAKGNVKPASDVKMTFEKSARVESVNIKVGDKVTSGQVLASLVDTDLSAQLMQARASVQSAESLLANYQAAYQAQQAKLNDLRSGARTEDLDVSQTKIDNAQRTLTDANTNLDNVKNKAQIDLNNVYIKTTDTLNDAYAKSFDAVNTKISDLFIDPLFDPKMSFITSNQTLEFSVETERKNANTDLESVRTQIDSTGNDPVAVENVLKQTQTRLENCRKLLKDLSELLNYGVTSVTFTQTTLNTYKTNVSTALSSVNTALASLQTQSQAITVQKTTNKNAITAAEAQVTQAKNAITSAQKEMELKRAGSSRDALAAQEELVRQAQASVDAQRAAISQAQANVMNYQYQLSKSTLKAPMDGTITQVDIEVGEIAPITAPVISIMSNAKFQIEAKIPESDIEKIQVGQTANVILDAYGSDKPLSAKVISIDPAQILVNNAPNYKVTLEFGTDDPIIKDGLSASVKISIGESREVIEVPEVSVLQKNGNQIVLVKNNGKAEERTVTTGAKQNGMVEIVTGLNPGEQVVDFGINN